MEAPAAGTSRRASGTTGTASLSHRRSTTAPSDRTSIRRAGRVPAGVRRRSARETIWGGGDGPAGSATGNAPAARSSSVLASAGGSGPPPRMSDSMDPASRDVEGSASAASCPSGARRVGSAPSSSSTHCREPSSATTATRR
ncbi:MAG TPA: hypothetical protein VND93_31195 [Myxococcales bacterium]|nr:hypothetical protein [Myxococcales bacterium]